MCSECKFVVAGENKPSECPDCGKDSFGRTFKPPTHQGTITWLEIAKGELPPIADGEIVSDEILLCLPGNRIHIGQYYDNGEKTWWLTSGGFCHPTHWAFVNLPQPLNT